MIICQARLSLPPSINECYTIGYVPVHVEKKPRIVSSASLKRYKELAAWELKDTGRCRVAWDEVKKIQGTHTPLSIEMIYFFKTLWKRDIDGGDKHVQDVVCKHLGLNDTLIIKKQTEKHADRTNTRVEVTISTIEE